MSYIPPQTITGLVLTGKVKKADTTRTNTATVADDPDLVVALKANTRYLVTADLIFTSSLVAGFKMGWGLPANATIQYVNVGQNDGLVKNLLDLIGLTLTTTNPNYMFLRGIVKTGATAGNVSIKWAQNVASSASGAVLKAESSLTVIELV
ncbi:hypothetical protein [Agrobacterium tumefaciens]|uniref:Uncharacterized protein n=1 Tax=Agrobacterium tumefaciens TaxID=358 RepID=A0A176WXV8_AGRTU|nr:hypothetical protein [Agrobacterium tumefaciens]OAE37640.1 hypothetical protein A7J57_08665 [Agrobacterium tumefaciens]